jgi:hypothetical protein
MERSAMLRICTLLLGCWSVAIIAPSATGYAGIVAYHGWERDFWDNHCVVLAKVTLVTPTTEPDGRKTLKVDASVLEVLATDSAVPTALSFKAFPWPGLGNGAIEDDPVAGSMYLFCLERRDNAWIFVMNYFGLFECNTTMQPVKSDDDRLVRRAEHNIAWARAKSFALRFESEEARRAATQASQPAPKRPVP